MKRYKDTDYYITEDGDVYSNKYDELRKRKLVLVKDGYYRISLYINGKNKKTYVHRMVAETFIPNPNDLYEINHIDGVKTNNNVSNLEWCDRMHNMQHAHKNGLIKLNPAKGEKHYNTKLTDEQIRWIRDNYIPRHPEFGCTAMAKKLNYDQGALSKILNNKIWKHI